MRFIYGLIGALLGAVTAVFAEFFVLAVSLNGDEFGIGLIGIVLSPWAAGIGAVLGAIVSQLVFRQVARFDLDENHDHRMTCVYSICGPILLSALCLFGTVQLTKSPSDADVIANFQQNSSRYSQLASMVAQDHGIDYLTLIDPQDGSISNVKLKPSRIASYRKLMKSAGMCKSMYASSGEVDFDLYSQGSAVSSDFDKGIVYMPKPPSQMKLYRASISISRLLLEKTLRVTASSRAIGTSFIKQTMTSKTGRAGVNSF